MTEDNNPPRTTAVGLGACALVAVSATASILMQFSKCPYVRTPLLPLAIATLLVAGATLVMAVAGRGGAVAPWATQVAIGTLALVAGGLVVVGNLQELPVLNALALGLSIVLGIILVVDGRRRLGARLPSPTLVWLGAALIAFACVGLLFWLVVASLPMPT